MGIRSALRNLFITLQERSEARSQVAAQAKVQEEEARRVVEETHRIERLIRESSDRIYRITCNKETADFYENFIIGVKGLRPSEKDDIAKEIIIFLKANVSDDDGFSNKTGLETWSNEESAMFDIKWSQYKNLAGYTDAAISRNIGTFIKTRSQLEIMDRIKKYKKMGL